VEEVGNEDEGSYVTPTYKWSAPDNVAAGTFLLTGFSLDWKCTNLRVLIARYSGLLWEIADDSPLVPAQQSIVMSVIFALAMR
jgi:hypothetical protein